MTDDDRYPVVLEVREMEFGQFELDGDLRTLPQSTGEHFDLQQRGEASVEQKLDLIAPYNFTEAERELYDRMGEVVGFVPEDAPLSGLAAFHPDWSVGDRMTFRVVWFAFRRCFPAEANRIRSEIDIGPLEQLGADRVSGSEDRSQ